MEAQLNGSRQYFDFLKVQWITIFVVVVVVVVIVVVDCYNWFLAS